MRKRVLLIGGFNKTLLLSRTLIEKGYDVTVVNNDYQNCLKLAEIDALTVIKGDGTKPYVLEDANAQNADIAIALTQKDDENLVICGLCKKRFNVKKTVALINDERKTEFFYKMGIDSVVCAITAITNIIEHQAFLDEIATIMPVANGSISISEVLITATSPVIGKKLWEIDLPKEVIIGSILRNEKSIIPRGDTQIISGDLLVLISSDQQEIKAIKALTGKDSI